MANENEMKTSEVEDIRIENDLGRNKVSVAVESGGNDFVTLETGVWDYDAIVSALVRSKYSVSDVEAIVQNKLNGAMDADEEYAELTGWRNKCKERAAYLMNLGERQHGLVSEEWQERCKETLEKSKKEKLADIIAYDASDNVNGFKLNGMVVWLDKATRVGLMNSTTIAKSMGSETTDLWLGENKLTVECDKAIQLLSALEMYALECFNVTAKHKKEVSELTTIEEVESYDIKAGYPAQLEMNV